MAMTISSTPPPSPAAGDQWYSSVTGRTCIYYNDGTSSQWVQSDIANLGGAGPGNNGTVTQVIAGTGMVPAVIDSTGLISLADTPVLPGTYGDSATIPRLTVDQQGRITAVQAIAATGVGVQSLSAGTGIALTPSPITSAGTVSLAIIPVVPSTYGDASHTAQVTIDGYGRVTSATNVQIAASGYVYKGMWNANTNIPTITSSVGSLGWFYEVSVAGSTNLNGISSWSIGDRPVFNGTVWEKGPGNAITYAQVVGALGFTPSNIDSPAFTGVPTAATAAPGTTTTQIATAAFVAASFAPLASPTLTGVPAAPTAVPGTNTSQIASTAFVQDAIATGPFAPVASPTFTGVPAAPTAAGGTNTTQIATTAFVQTAIATGTFAPLASPTFTGVPAAPTAAGGTNTTQLATTAFVQTAIAAVGVATAADVRTATDNVKSVTSLALANAAVPVALTDAATIAWDGKNDGFNVKVTLGGNRAFGAPTSMIDGRTYVMFIIQDGTGGRTGVFNAAYDFGTAGVPTLSPDAGAEDMVVGRWSATSSKLKCVFWQATGAAVTAFSQTLDADVAGWSGFTARSVTTSNNAAGGTQVRVTFQAPAAGTMVVNNAAIGVSTGVASATVVTPVQLLFSAASGFTIANGATITSDWATLTTTTAVKLVVIVDHQVATSTARIRSAGGSQFNKSAASSYTQAAPTGMSSDQTTSHAFNMIEVR